MTPPSCGRQEAANACVSAYLPATLGGIHAGQNGAAVEGGLRALRLLLFILVGGQLAICMRSPK